VKSKRFTIISVVLVLGAGAFIWWSTSQIGKDGGASFSAAEPVGSSPITQLVSIGDQAYTVEVASTVEEQALGLSNRDSLDDNSGMLFPFVPASTVSFWMKDMRFALDIIWIANGKVVGIEKNIPPPQGGTETQKLPTYQPPQPVDFVLELNAGQSQFFRIGDDVTITKIQST
jgi:uncharacterized membrane protein (UPF0127 family)